LVSRGENRIFWIKTPLLWTRQLSTGETPVVVFPYFFQAFFTSSIRSWLALALSYQVLVPRLALALSYQGRSSGKVLAGLTITQYVWAVVLYSNV